MNRVKEPLLEIICVSNIVNEIYSYMKCSSCINPSNNNCVHCKNHCTIECILSLVIDNNRMTIYISECILPLVIDNNKIHSIIFGYNRCIEFGCHVPTNIDSGYCTYHNKIQLNDQYHQNTYDNICDLCMNNATFVSIDRQRQYCKYHINYVGAVYDLSEQCDYQQSCFRVANYTDDVINRCENHTTKDLRLNIITINDYVICVDCGTSIILAYKCFCNMTRCNPCTIQYTWLDHNNQRRCNQCTYVYQCSHTVRNLIFCVYNDCRYKRQNHIFVYDL